MRFANFYAPSPRCTPSRAGYFTGRSPAQLHMTFVNEGKEGKGGDKGGFKGGASSFSSTGSKLLPPTTSFELPANVVTLGDLLKKAGYATAHFGKWHLGRANPSTHGYDENDGANSNGGPDDTNNPNPKQTHLTAQRGIAFMEKNVRAGKPFYLQIDQYSGRSVEDASAETVKLLREKYHLTDERLLGTAAANYEVDLAIGELLANVQALGIADRTYVIYTADHGTQGRANEPLFGGKGTVWEGGLRVPLIVRGPGVAAGICSHVRAFGVDLLPTFAELAHIKELPANIEGGSLVGVLSGRGVGTVKRPREEYVVHFPHYDKDEQGPASAIILGDYKLVRVYETDARHLYNIAQDLGERTDLAATMPDKVADLDARLAAYLKAVDAQMPTPNPNYDPSKAPAPTQRKGKKGKP
jgi:arylsulfatase A-like enzyme